MRVFENPANGYKEEVGIGASVGVFFLGAVYLAIKGLWRHVFIWLVIVAPLTIATGGPGVIVFAPLACLIYAFFIQGILADDYLKKGWREVAGTTKSQEEIQRDEGRKAALAAQAAMREEKTAPSLKICPFCAEEIKAEAIKCKHCQSALEPQA